MNQQAIVEWLDLPPIDPKHWSCLLRRELLDGLLLPASEQELLGSYGNRIQVQMPNQPAMALICRPHPLVRNLVNTWFRS